LFTLEQLPRFADGQLGFEIMLEIREFLGHLARRPSLCPCGRSFGAEAGGVGDPGGYLWKISFYESEGLGF
jgi:hypothetical protein